MSDGIVMEAAPILEPMDELDRECLIPIDQWLDGVRRGGFVDYDGHGRLATANGVSGMMWVPSKGSPPAWATHICWYNR
jgi:hypothetical protein